MAASELMAIAEELDELITSVSRKKDDMDVAKKIAFDAEQIYLGVLSSVKALQTKYESHMKNVLTNFGQWHA